MKKNTNNLKKFNLAKALKGAAVVTRLGNDARIDCKAGDKLLVTIKSKVGPYMDRQVRVNLDGSRYSARHEHFEDIFMA